MPTIIYLFFALLAVASVARGASIPVPNQSFETPATDFASPELGAWQKAPRPFWYFDPTGFFPWEALMGQFQNPSNGAPDHIDNLDGQQGAYLFAMPNVAIFQDYTTIAGTNASPNREFNAQFAAGKSYTLTVGVLGGGGGMSNGATFEIAMYFRDNASNMITVGSTLITNTHALFPTNTHLKDFEVRIPIVKPSDDWAGKRIGIRLASALSLADTNLIGGYWDVDNVRLSENLPPNYSFESPVTDFAGPDIDAWEKAPEPFWYHDPTGFFPWESLMGQFANTPEGSADQIDNLEGKQGGYLFALPEVAIFQEYNSISGTNSQPTYDFNAKFEAGKSYALTVGVLGGGGGMSNGVPFEISLYYRDSGSNRITLASTTITNTKTLFPTNTHLLEFQARVPQVRSNDAWAGKFIGIRLASALTLLDTNLFGGYWDIDNVRLTESVVPNNSFESPVTDFAGPAIDAWQKAPEPGWYVDPTGFFPWESLMGQFQNTPSGSPDHIDNVDGKQGGYLFALPDVAVFQDYTSIGGTNSSPTHDFDLKYEIGNSYDLTVGVLGGGGGMSNGVTFAISFYYRDAASNKITIASTSITNNHRLFPTNTHLIDFTVQVPTVRGSEVWAGKHVGVQLASALTLLDSSLFGGYWDVDNVRLRVTRDPVLKNPGMNVDRQFQFTLSSSPGRYEVLSSTNIALPVAGWNKLGVITSVTGSVPVTETNLGNRFYQVRTSP